MDVGSGDNLPENEPQRTNKFDKTLLASFFTLSFTMGLVYEILSPTLDDLANITNSSIVEISTLFQVRSGAYALGSLTGGGIYHMTVPLIAMVIALLINLTSITWVGFLRNIYQMNFAIAINGFTTGIMDVGTNVYLLRSYQEKSTPYVLTLYAVFGLGCSFLNIYTAPFLSQGSSNLTSVAINSQDTNLNQLASQSNGVIWVPFLLTGIFNLSPLVLLLILFFHQMSFPKNQRLPLMTSYGEQSRAQGTNESPRSQHSLILTIFAGLMIMFYCGVDIVFSEYLIISLKRSSLGISGSQASYMKSVMYISHTAAKFLFIYISTLVKPATILIANCLLTLFSSMVLIFCFDTSIEMIWIFIVILGISTSSLYPSMLPFINEYLSIDHLNGSLMLFLGSIMAIIYPSIIGSFLDQEPAFSLYLEAGTMIITLILIFSIKYVGKQNSLENSSSPLARLEISPGTEEQ